MITVFSIPKPATGAAAVHQRNAVGSWTRLAAGVQVVLFGDDDGVAELASEAGAEHEPNVARNEWGTPLVDGVFRAAAARARHDVLLFANADVLLFGDLVRAVRAVEAGGRSFLLVGESWDVELEEALSFEPGWEGRVRRLQRRRRGAPALDWFVYARGLYDEVLPPFAVGRAGFDNWLVWRARSAGALVLDATPCVLALHQRHDYGHVRGGLAATRTGPEAAANWALVGGKDRLYTRYDATHRLTRRGLRRNLGGAFRLKERARKAVWKLRRGQLLPAKYPP
jgi:hypothetical protein